MVPSPRQHIALQVLQGRDGVVDGQRRDLAEPERGRVAGQAERRRATGRGDLVVHVGQRVEVLRGDRPDHHQHRGVARGGHDAHAVVGAQPCELAVATEATRDDHRHRGGGREAIEPSRHCHRRAPSRHAYSTPSESSARNTPISTRALTPIDANTTAHGYMNIISISNAMRTRVMG